MFFYALYTVTKQEREEREIINDQVGFIVFSLCKSIKFNSIQFNSIYLFRLFHKTINQEKKTQNKSRSHGPVKRPKLVI